MADLSSKNTGSIAEYMTWYTPETEIDVQTVREELGSRAMELTIATETLTETDTDVRVKDQDAAEFGDSGNTSMSIDDSNEGKQKGMDEATRQKLIQMLEESQDRFAAASRAHEQRLPESTIRREEEYRKRRRKAPSHWFGDSFVAYT